MSLDPITKMMVRIVLFFAVLTVVGLIVAASL